MGLITTCPLIKGLFHKVHKPVKVEPISGAPKRDYTQTREEGINIRSAKTSIVFDPRFRCFFFISWEGMNLRESHASVIYIGNGQVSWGCG